MKRSDHAPEMEISEKFKSFHLDLPSFYPFFYKNLKNSTYFELLRNTVTNKCTTKKIEHEEGTVEMN